MTAGCIVCTVELIHRDLAAVHVDRAVGVQIIHAEDVGNIKRTAVDVQDGAVFLRGIVAGVGHVERVAVERAAVEVHRGGKPVRRGGGVAVVAPEREEASAAHDAAVDIEMPGRFHACILRRRAADVRIDAKIRHDLRTRGDHETPVKHAERGIADRRTVAVFRKVERLLPVSGILAVAADEVRDHAVAAGRREDKRTRARLEEVAVSVDGGDGSRVRHCRAIGYVDDRAALVVSGEREERDVARERAAARKAERALGEDDRRGRLRR